MREQVTLAEVAHAAGVSTATASRILSGARRGDPQTAARVRDSAESLGYVGNSIARALRRGRTGNIGMIVPSIGNPFFTGLVDSVERQLASRDLNLFLCDSRGGSSTEAARVRSLLQGNVDGILISPCDVTASRAALEEAAEVVPIVQLDRHVEDSDGDRVILDDDHSMGEVVKHLAHLGVRTAAFVSSTALSSSATLRLEAVRRWADELGIALEDRELLDGDFSMRWGAEAADRILERRSLPDAVICGDDVLAIGIMARFAQRGVSVPTDVMVTGFDDIDLAALSTPTLTTLRQPREQMADEAVRLLCNRIEEPTTRGSLVTLRGELVARASTASSAG